MVNPAVGVYQSGRPGQQAGYGGLGPLSPQPDGDDLRPAGSRAK